MEIEDVSMALEVTEILIGRKVLLQEGFDLWACNDAKLDVEK